MKKTVRLLAALTVVFVLSACGGGGGGESAPATPTPPVVVVSPSGTGTLQGSTISPTVTPLVVPFSGVLRSATAVLWQGAIGGTSIDGVAGVANVLGENVITFAPTVRLVFGRAFTLVITAEDSLGRKVEATIAFSTSPMSCVNSAVWSNPATFSEPLQNCVALIGVQAKVTPFNTVQDNSCTPTVGALLSPACRVYLANGTFLLANTALVVNGHATLWGAYVGLDGKSNIVLFDINDPANPVPLGTMVLPSPLVWEIGNPTGESISIKTGVVGNETDQVTWDVTTGTLKRTCLVRCA